MSMLPGHWAWQRQRAEHHCGAVRAYARDSVAAEYLDSPRGPLESPRGPCSRCAALLANHNTSLYQTCSSSSSSSDEDDDDWTIAETAGRSTHRITHAPCLLTGGSCI